MHKTVDVEGLIKMFIKYNCFAYDKKKLGFSSTKEFIA